LRSLAKPPIHQKQQLVHFEPIRQAENYHWIVYSPLSHRLSIHLVIMRLSVSLSLAALSQLSSAFYPYTPLPDDHTSTPSTRDLSLEKRSPFYPYSLATPEADHTSHTSPRSIQQPREVNNGAIRISLRKRLAKRQNKFNVLAADIPKQSNSAGVDQDGTDFSYFASFKFGASSKTFYLLLDSAASNTWVMSSDCSSSACGIHTTFGPSDSSSLKVRMLYN